MNIEPTSRRRFLAAGTASATAGLLAPNLLVNLRAQAPSKKLNIACIGAGGKGESDRKSSRDEGNNIVAICDVDSNRLAKALKEDPGAKGYSDFRKMLDEMGKSIDAVTVSTPDHAHFPAAMMAIGMGKHVCVQKPLTNTIWEARQLHKAAKAKGVVTQMGNQGRTMEGQRLAKEWIAQGAIGKLKEIKLWTNRPIWPQGKLTKKAAPTPATLDWDSWIAQEKFVDYFEFEPGDAKRGATVHPFNWRGWWAYGAGALGDMGCHIMDAAFSILGQAIPEKIEVETAPVYDLTAPTWTNLVYHFAPRGDLPAIKVSWQDGKFMTGQPNKPERPKELAELSDEGWRKATSGMLFIGSDGVLFEGEAYCESPVIYPLARFNDVKRMMAEGKIKKTEARSTHPKQPQQEWANAIKNGLPTSSGFDYSVPLTEFVLLGNLAIRSGQTVEWDAANMKVTNVPEANRFVKRPAYRKGWSFEA